MINLNKNNLIDIIKNRIECEGLGRIILITKFGSHLYGTNTENSDTDIFGVFVPNIEDILMNNIPKHISFSTSNHKRKNTKDDIDVVMVSLQYFLNELNKGDINMLATLFSMSNPDNIIFKDGFEFIFNNRHNLITRRVLKKGSFGYIFKQRNNLSKLDNEFKVLLSKLGGEITTIVGLSNKFTKNTKLFEIVDLLMEKFPDKLTIFETTNDNGSINKFLVVDDLMKFNFNDKVSNVLKKLNKRINLILSMDNLINSKRISNSFRLMEMIEEFLDTGDIKFPLKNREFLIKIKKGEFDTQELIKLMKTQIDRIKQKLDEREDLFVSKDVVKETQLKIVKHFLNC